MNRSRYSMSWSLVGAERVRFELVQVDRPLEGAHERLRVLGQVAATLRDVAQQQRGGRGVRIGRLGQLVQRAQAGRDVLEGDRLKRAATTEMLIEDFQRALGGLACPGELVEVARAVEVLDRRHSSGVGIGAEVSPLDELPERGGDRLRVAADVVDSSDVLAAQVHDEPALGGDEGEHHPPVESGVRRSPVRERLEPSGFGIALGRCGCHRLAHGGRWTGWNVDGLSTLQRVPSTTTSTFRRA